MDKARTIVDYTEQDNAKEVRDTLYSALQDRVMAHIEAHKQVVAQNIMNPPEAAVEDEAIQPEVAT
jgi:hypothetical protein